MPETAPQTKTTPKTQTARGALSVLQRFQSLNSEFPLQYAVCLLEIALNEGLSLTDLATKTNMALSTVSRIVGALSTQRQQGIPYQLVEARVNPNNRRQKEIYLTSQGRSFVKTLTA